MTRYRHITIAGLLLLIGSACSTPVQNSTTESSVTPAASPPAQRITSESVVKVKAERVEIPSGGSAEAIVKMTIKSGYHVNANPPTYPYLKATELEIAPAGGISVGLVRYPNGLSRKFSFAEKPLSVYQGETELRAMLKADRSAKPGSGSISTKLRIQACDEQVCYPPGTLELTIPVEIK